MSKHTRRYLFLAATALTLVVAEPALRATGPDLRLIDAVRLRDHKAFATLLRSKVDINAAEPDGATALAWAVHLGERGMAESLVKAGANPNTTDGYGETPLTLACANGDGILVQRLLAGRRHTRSDALERRDTTDARRRCRQYGCRHSAGPTWRRCQRR